MVKKKRKDEGNNIDADKGNVKQDLILLKEYYWKKKRYNPARTTSFL